MTASPSPHAAQDGLPEGWALSCAAYHRALPGEVDWAVAWSVVQITVRVTLTAPDGTRYGYTINHEALEPRRLT